MSYIFNPRLCYCHVEKHEISVLIIFIKPILIRAKEESGRSGMEEQYASLNHVPPFCFETSFGSKPANRAMAKYPATLPCECYLSLVILDFQSKDDVKTTIFV